MRVKMLSMLAGLMLAGCPVPGSVSVSGASGPYWDGHAYVTVTSHVHCANCGHYFYDGGWNLYPIEYVYLQPGYGRRSHGHGHGDSEGHGHGHGDGHGGGK
jgi:hypothetical protein